MWQGQMFALDLLLALKPSFNLWFQIIHRHEHVLIHEVNAMNQWYDTWFKYNTKRILQAL